MSNRQQDVSFFMVNASFWSPLRKYFLNMVKQKRINVPSLLTGKKNLMQFILLVQNYSNCLEFYRKKNNTHKNAISKAPV